MEKFALVPKPLNVICRTHKIILTQSFPVSLTQGNNCDMDIPMVKYAFFHYIYDFNFLLWKYYWGRIGMQRQRWRLYTKFCDFEKTAAVVLSNQMEWLIYFFISTHHHLYLFQTMPNSHCLGRAWKEIMDYPVQKIRASNAYMVQERLRNRILRC